MTHRMDKQPDPDQAQFHDLALVHAHTASVQAAARRLQSDPTGTSAITEMKMLLGVPTTLARSALDRLQGRNRSGARLRLVPLEESPGGEQ